MNPYFEPLAKKLHEQELLADSHRNEGRITAWNAQAAEDSMRKKVQQFKQDRSLFEQEASRMAEYERKLPELYRPYINSSELTDMAIALWARKNHHLAADVEKEYHKSGVTALTWKHGRANPELSHLFFDVNDEIPALIAHIIAEDKDRMLGRPVASTELRQAIGEIKYDRSDKGRKPGRQELFLHDAPGSERYMNRLALLAGIGVQHLNPAPQNAMQTQLR